MADISRRHAIRSIAGSAACGALAAAWSPGRALAGALTGTQDTTQEQWFEAWLSSKPPEGALHLYRFADEIYSLTKPIAWTPGPKNKDFQRVDVPPGFVTDFASVPKIFWSVLPRDGKYTYPAIVHDYMYWMQDRPRETADEIFRIGMEEFDISSVTVNAVYWSVRAAGGSAWDGNAALKAKGEKRVLRRVPTDPLVRWANWKKDPSVFE